MNTEERARVLIRDIEKALRDGYVHYDKQGRRLYTVQQVLKALRLDGSFTTRVPSRSESDWVPPEGSGASAFIEEKSVELVEAWVDGNREYVLQRLESLPPKIAFAIVSVMTSELGTPERFVDYLKEMA